MKYKQGDIVKSEASNRIEIQGNIGKVYVTLILYASGSVGTCLISEQELDERGYKLFNPNADNFPQKGDTYYYPDLNWDKKFSYGEWNNHENDLHIKKTLGIYKTKEEAIAKADKILETIKNIR